MKLKNFIIFTWPPPEFLSENESSFSYKKSDNVAEDLLFDDLNINDLVSIKNRRLKDLTVERIKGWRIYKYNEISDTAISYENAYNCLVAEIDLGGVTYILSSGYWKEVSQSLKLEVDDYLNKIKLNDTFTYLPQKQSIISKDKKAREACYNNEAAKQCADLFLFDRAQIQIDNVKKYEMCDLFHKEKTMVHVKRACLLICVNAF